MERINCDFCGSTEQRVKYQVRSAKYHPEYLYAETIVGPEPPEVFSIVECNVCKLLYVNPRYDAGELLAVYPEEQYTNRAFFFSGSILFRKFGAIPKVQMRGEAVDSRKNRNRMEQIHRFKTGGRILDVGCCNGSFLALMEQRDWETHGVDFSQTAIDNARNTFGQDRAVCGELADAGYPDDYFDVITLYDTIEHVPNPRKVLEEAVRVGKKDALLIIQTNDFESLNARLMPHSLLYPAQHLYYFRKRDLCDLLAPHGYGLVDEHFETIGFVRFVYYLAMNWWTRGVVALHRRERGAWREWCRRLLVGARVIFDEDEVLKRLKMVGANNIPAFRADKTFYFLNVAKAESSHAEERFLVLAD
jgi:SAM-dependent methyltransferase